MPLKQPDLLKKKSTSSARSLPKESIGGFASRRDIVGTLKLSDAELTRGRRRFPVQWPEDYLKLVDTTASEDPIAKMGRPDPQELLSDPGDLADANGDMLKRPLPFLVRKHADRIIVLVTKRCHFYCRFCFRREDPPSSKTELNSSDWDHVFHYLTQEKDLREVILSGGDPLVLENSRLFWLKENIQKIDHITHWRIHSRAPVHFPKRLQEPLIAGLAKGLPLRVVTHFNHLRELTNESRRVAHLFARYRIPVLNQAVLLRGVNNTLHAQLQLWRALKHLNIQAYYLHHPDRVTGNAHFRVSISDGLKLIAGIKKNLGAESPRYVLDLPDGSGKVPVEDLVALGKRTYQYQHSHSKISTYQDIPEEESGAS